jgi:hypothetical protein
MSGIVNSTGAVSGVIGTTASGARRDGVPSFRAVGSSQAIAHVNHVTVIYPTVQTADFNAASQSWDSHGLYDTSTGKFTVTASTTGYYRITGNFGPSAMDAARIQCTIWVNQGGSDYAYQKQEWQYYHSSYPGPIVTADVKLTTAGWYTFITAYHNQGTSENLANEAEKNIFSGYKIYNH